MTDERSELEGALEETSPVAEVNVEETTQEMAEQAAPEVAEVKSEADNGK